jgi:hypothetical protein
MLLGMDILKHTEAVRTRLHSSSLTHAAIRAASGNDLSLSWISKFGRGEIDNPSVHSLALLEQTLNALETERAA